MGANATAGTRPAEHADPALAYYERARRAFAGACATTGCVEHGLGIAGTAVRLRFAGRALASAVLPSLSPLLCPTPLRPDFEVELWDAASTGVTIPDPPWRRRDVLARGDVRGLGERVRAQMDSGNELLTLWDARERRGIMWAGDADRLPYWTRCDPLRTILHWGLAGDGRHLIHAAAVGGEAAGALLVGPSGSGKSTTSLACLRDGLGYVADDYVLAESAPSPRAVALYGMANVSATSLRLLPELAPACVPMEAPKFALDVARVRPDAVRSAVPISAIILPRVSAGRLAFRPATAAQALRALAPSTILQHAEESDNAMAVISALVRQVPAYALDLGSDIAAVPPAIREILDASA